jgi:adenylate cyclase
MRGGHAPDGGFFVRVYRFGEFELRPGERVLTCGGRPVSLGARAFDLLSYLIDHRERVVSKEELLDHVWPGIAVEEANLTVHVSALRKALGSQALSTVTGRGYRFVLPVSDAAPAPSSGLPEPRRPSIAVLPFANLSGDSEQEYFADGLVEDLIVTLSKISGLTVIARASSFYYKGRAVDVRQVGRELGVRYVLEGSVRNSGGRTRIAAQLIDAETGAHVWAERYDRAIEDIFALQDEITLILVTEMQVHLTEGDQARLRYSSIHNLEAWSFWVRGLARYHGYVLSREGLTTTLMAWQRAAALDPRSATIQAMLGMLYYIDARFEFWNDRDTALSKGLAHVERALSLDGDCADAFMVQGLLLLLQLRHAQAVAASRRSMVLGPGSADVAAFGGFVLANAGEGAEAVQVIERAIRLCPMYPPFYLGHLGFAYRVAGRVQDAIAAFEGYDRGIAGRGVTDLAIIHEQLGESGKARAWAAKLLSVLPDFTISAWRKTQFRSDAEGLAADIRSLDALGLPP